MGAKFILVSIDTTISMKQQEFILAKFILVSIDTTISMKQQELAK